MVKQNFFIRCEGKYIRVDTKDICYVEALKNYVRIVTVHKTYMVLISLRQLEEELPKELFCRVHRSYIVSMAHVQEFDNELVYLSSGTVPISPAHREALPSRVKILVSATRSRMVMS